MAKNVKEKEKANLPTKRVRFSDYAGGGLEETTSDSFSIPFLQVLQKGSPPVDEASGKQLKGAKAGMIFESIGQQLIDGKVGCELVQAHYRSVYLRWGARDAGGGFKGEITREAVAKMRNEGIVQSVEGLTLFVDKNGEIDKDESDRAIDTRIHYMLLVDRKNKTWKRCVLSLSRTQVRKSRHLMSMFADYKLKEADGTPYTPPSFQHIIKMTTVPEKNDQGTWYGVDFAIVTQFDDPHDPIFQAAVAFKETVMSGNASAKFTEDGTEE